MRRTRAFRHLVLAMAILATSAAAAAQTAPAANPRPVPPYSAFISGDLVNIRSGPGLYYYAVVAAAQNTPVVVDSETRDWLALRPLPDVRGLVAESDVALSADGKTATVSAPTARVYASGPVAKRRWCVMAMVPQGTALAVAGPAEGGFVRVVPPEGSHVYVLTQYVTPIASAVPTPTGGPVVSIEIAPPTTDPAMQDYKDASAALAAELAKPVDQRDYDAVSARFADVAAKAEKAWLKSVAAREVRRIAALKEEQEAYRRTVAIADRLDTRMTELATARAEAETEAQRDAALQRPAFQATGVVAPLESLEGVDYPIKYKLIDQAGRPVVVLQSDRYNLADYVGKAVGVRGTRQFLPDWKTYLVTVDDLEVLE